MEKSYWDKEEFEDLVARSIIGLYEIKINKKCLRVPDYLKPRDIDINSYRKFGAYFPPNDRLAESAIIDLQNGDIPKKAALTSPIFNNENKWLPDEYLRFHYFEQIPFLPKALFGVIKGMPYKYICASPSLNNKLFVQKSFVIIDKNGYISDTYTNNPNNGEPVCLSIGCLKNQTDESFNCVKTDILATSSTINLFQDRKFLWNVTATEQKAKATFGIYEEQVKSLFYARELPMTETGRKRPILHWVASHQRRIKNGIEIDINKHLRGINEFIYQGTKFVITRPIKEIK